MGRPLGSKNKPKTESEPSIRPEKIDNPLTKGTFEVMIRFQDNTTELFCAGAIPRVVEGGILLVIIEGGAMSIPISNNIKFYTWKVKEAKDV